MIMLTLEVDHEGGTWKLGYDTSTRKKKGKEIRNYMLQLSYGVLAGEFLVIM